MCGAGRRQAWGRYGTRVGRFGTDVGRWESGMGHVCGRVWAEEATVRGSSICGGVFLCLPGGACGRSGRGHLLLFCEGALSLGRVDGLREEGTGLRSQQYCVEASRPGPHLPCSYTPHTGSHVCAAGGTGRKVHSHSSRAPKTRQSPRGLRTSHTPCEEGATGGLAAEVCWPVSARAPVMTGHMSPELRPPRPWALEGSSRETHRSQNAPSSSHHTASPSGD